MTDDTNELSLTRRLRVLRHGVLVATELCESSNATLAAMQRWDDLDGVAFEIDVVATEDPAGDDVG